MGASGALAGLAGSRPTLSPVIPRYDRRDQVVPELGKALSIARDNELLGFFFGRGLEVDLELDPG